jgi:hypothetical protein
MLTNIHILTQKTPTSAHTETDLWIDWDGVSDEMMRTMAQFYIQHRVQAGFKYCQGSIPDVMKIRAMDYVHPEAVKERNLSEATKKKQSNLSEFEKIINSLPAADRAKVMAELSKGL